MLLLYILFLGVDLKQLKSTFKNVKYTSTAILINFLITPIIAFILGNVFFGDSIEIRIGLLMLLVTPCTDWYLVFTGISKVNVELNISIFPSNLILQVVLMPVYLMVLLENEVQLEVLGILQSILFVLFIPFFLSLISNKLIKNKRHIKNWTLEQSDNLQLLFLCIAVVVMFAAEGSSLFENPTLLVRLFVPLVIFFALLFTISQTVGTILKFDKRDIIALSFTTLARNSPLSLAIAVVAFPEYSLTSLALVVGPLIELPILSLISSVLQNRNT